MACHNHPEMWCKEKLIGWKKTWKINNFLFHSWFCYWTVLQRKANDVFNWKSNLKSFARFCFVKLNFFYAYKLELTMQTLDDLLFNFNQNLFELQLKIIAIFARMHWTPYDLNVEKVINFGLLSVCGFVWHTLNTNLLFRIYFTFQWGNSHAFYYVVCNFVWLVVTLSHHRLFTRFHSIRLQKWTDL